MSLFSRALLLKTTILFGGITTHLGHAETIQLTEKGYASPGKNIREFIQDLSTEPSPNIFRATTEFTYPKGYTSLTKSGNYVGAYDVVKLGYVTEVKITYRDTTFSNTSLPGGSLSSITCNSYYCEIENIEDFYISGVIARDFYDVLIDSQIATSDINNPIKAEVTPYNDLNIAKMPLNDYDGYSFFCVADTTASNASFCRILKSNILATGVFLPSF